VLDRLPQKGISLIVKRLVDVLGSLVILILISPLIFIVLILILLFQGRPLLFQQVRVGRYEKEFVMYKFCTMTHGKDSDGKLLPDNERVTGIGKWIRRFSIDELPQLMNVLMGNMSLVGNRPLLPKYLGRMTARHRRRYLTLPGISCLSAIDGHRVRSWEDQFEIDLEYVDRWNLLFDFRIMMLTIWTIIKNEKRHGHQTEMRDEFRGE
jgi:sugar transferase EpsL